MTCGEFIQITLHPDVLLSWANEVRSERNREAYRRFLGKGAGVSNKGEEVRLHLDSHKKGLKSCGSQLLGNI